MPVTDVHKDPEALTMRITTELDAPIERAWQLWEDPRQLEQWWGPPTWPATVVDHDLSPGGAIRYYMTGPEGEKAGGWWRVLTVEAPHRLEFEDGFADGDGNPDPAMPSMIIRVQLSPQPNGGTTMTVETSFPSVEVMEQMLTMGMDEGMTLAMGQMDAILAG